MLEQIANLVKEYGQETVVSNPEIPNEQNNAVLSEATHTITGGLQNMLAGGGLQDIISLFTGGGNSQPADTAAGANGGLLNNPAVSAMVSNLVQSLVSKFNMSPAQANTISGNLVPTVLNGLISRTRSNDPAHDAFDLNDLIGSLTGGNVATRETTQGGFDFQGLLNQFTGNGGSGSAGGLNIQDIIGQVTRGAQDHQKEQNQGAGGIGDLIKGLFN